MRSNLLRRCTQFSAVLLFFYIAGCSRTKVPPSHPSGGGGIQFWTSPGVAKPVPGFDEGSVIFGSFKGGTLLIWSDTDSVSGGFPISLPLAKADGTLEYYQSNRRIKYSCEYNVDSGSGNCTINEKTHDLQKGSVLLVSGTSAEVRVQQLSRDLNTLRDALGPKFDREKLIAFGKGDPDITKFFSSLPTVEPEGKDPEGGDRRKSYTLHRPQIEWSDHANVHVHFLQPARTSDENPFFVVWTDARLYAGSDGYPSANSNPLPNFLVKGHRNLRWGGKENGFDREVKYSFEINLSEKGQFAIEGKTYDFEKGALFLISGQDADVRVKQLSRDASKLPSDEAAVIAFGKADAEIDAFFAKKAKNK